MRMPDTVPDSLAAAPAPAGVPHDNGWTRERKARFLALLAENGNVRLAAARCGLSAQSAYKLRRRDALFARSWAAAVLLARDHSEQVMADRALEGVEEPVFYRGEQVGVRRRYDTRLLLAHMARLDALACDRAAGEDAGRFDELLALVSGEHLPDALGEEREGGGALPAAREAYAAAAAHAASEAQDRALPPARGKADRTERSAALAGAGEAARAAAGARWDQWFAQACARVDALGRTPLPLHLLPGCPVLARPGLKAWTLSTVSTTGLAMGLAGGQSIDRSRHYPVPLDPRKPAAGGRKGAKYPQPTSSPLRRQGPR